jgi:uncharacterized membrane protein
MYSARLYIEMKCDFCDKDSHDAIIIVGKKKLICECCIGQVVDVILKRKNTSIVDVDNKGTVCDVCESEESLFFFKKRRLHVCSSCLGACLESLATINLKTHLEGTSYKQGKSKIKKGANFEF